MDLTKTLSWRQAVSWAATAVVLGLLASKVRSLDPDTAYSWASFALRADMFVIPFMVLWLVGLFGTESRHTADLYETNTLDLVLFCFWGIALIGFFVVFLAMLKPAWPVITVPGTDLIRQLRHLRILAFTLSLPVVAVFYVASQEIMAKHQEKRQKKQTQRASNEKEGQRQGHEHKTDQ